MQVNDQKDYTILGRRYCQRELSVLRCQRLSVTEAWRVMTAGDSSGLELYMSPEQCAEFFNAVLIPVEGSSPKFEQFAEFSAADFSQIGLSQVGEVFGDFCFFNPVLTSSLVIWTGLSQALAAQQAEAGAGVDPNTGNILRTPPAAGTSPN